MTLLPMRETSPTQLDCCGQQCPGPILATAKVARTLGGAGGGILEISADDDAFPLDIRSWCRSSNSELVELTVEGGVHRAVVRVQAARPTGTNKGKALPVVRIQSPPPVPVPVPVPVPARPVSGAIVVDLPAVLDCRGQSCPGPILTLARRARALGPGAQLEVLADDPAFKLDLESWCRSSRATLLSLEAEGSGLRAHLKLAGHAADGATTTRISPERPPPEPAPATSIPVISLRSLAPDQRLPQLEQHVSSLPGGSHIRVVSDDTDFSVPLVQWASAAGHRLLSLDARDSLDAQIELCSDITHTALALVESAQLEPTPRDNVCTLLVLHNDKEALLAALLVAVGAATQGMDVMMFYTFWGLNLLRGDEPNSAMPAQKVSWAQRMFKWMMPRGPRRQKLGKLNMGGIGGGMLGSIMKRYDLMDVPELLAAAEEQGVRFVACTMSMQVMGITKRDLAPRENLEYGGVAAFVESAARSRMSLTF